MIEDLRNPTEVTEDFWIYAKNPAKQPKDTDYCGKWMLFISTQHIDAVWEKIREATRASRLGIAAKAATMRDSSLSDSSAKVICVYTKDYRDVDDVRKVLAGLRGLGFNQRIFYKEDNATLAGHYGAGNASLYGSPGGDVINIRREPFLPTD